METKKILFFILTIIILQPLFAENKITLDECQQKARENYPMIKQYDLLSKSETYTLTNITKTYLPQFAINGQANYQSDVTTIPIDFASLGLPIDIKSINKDQYKATIDLTQTIWDGGVSKAQKEITKNNTETEKQQLEVTLYQIKQKVNELYFGILALDEQLKMLYLLEEDLNSNKKMMMSMFNNGTITQSDLDQIEVELLTTYQNILEQQAIKDSFFKMLSLYIHDDLDTDTFFETPQNIIYQNSKIQRPELNFYNSKRLTLESERNAIKAKNMPQIRLFAQGGYGRPGLNMLENNFKLYAIGGIRFSWNLSNLYTKKNEEHLIALKIGDVSIQEEIFIFSTNIQLTKQLFELKKIEGQLEKDNEIITLRMRVKKAAESKYKNGVYTINDLIKDINSENRARQQKALREVQYLQSIYSYRNIQGY